MSRHSSDSAEHRARRLTGRLASLMLAAVVLVVAVMHPAFRDGDALTGLFVVPLSVSVALCLLATAGVSAWTLLAGLFVVGQAVTLQLIRAGNAVGYQHWLPVQELVRSEAALFPALQAGILVWAYRWARGRDRIGPPRLRMGWRLILLAGLFTLAGTALSREPSVYVAELVVASVCQALQLANLALAILLVPRDRIEAWGERMNQVVTGADACGRPRLDRFVLIAAAWATATAAILAYFVYQGHPHIPDEVSFLIQARYFAAGKLAMAAPPVPAAFNLDLMTYEATRWYSPLTPAWPAMLAVGVLVGAPWAVNPALTGAAVVLAYLFVGDLYGRRIARLTTLLLCVSPWFIYTGSNLMNHQWTLIWALLGALGVSRARQPGPGRWPRLVVAGIALGVLAMLRPLEGLCMAILLGLWALLSAPDRGVRRLLPVAVLAAVSMAMSAFQLGYNRALTGKALAFPVMDFLHDQYGEGSNALGFGPDRGFGWTGLDPLPGHDGVDVAINAMLNAFLVNVELFGWSFGSLLPIFLLYLFGRQRREDKLMTAAAAAVIVVHAFYWFSGGPDFGARYWYLIILPCAVLTVRGLESVRRRLGSDNARSARVLGGAALLGLSALTTFVPWRAADKYFHYRNMRPDVRNLAADHDFGRALILIRGRRHPDYASAAVYNPVDLNDGVPIYAWGRDPDVTAQLLDAYRDRQVWVVDGPTRTGNGFKVVQGPMPADRFLEDMSAGR